MRKFKTESASGKFNDDQATKDKVFEAVVEFFLKHEAFSGESVQQNDGPQIEAPELLADLVDDIIKFDVKWND